MNIGTNKRRLGLTAWLYKNQTTEFYSALKLQKYMFLYEAFSKLQDLEYDYGYLRAYENGPVFSDLYGDYTYRKDGLVSIADNYPEDEIEIDEEIALKASFVVKILNEEELSDFTHELDAWKINEEEIGTRSQIPIRESHFTDDDYRLLYDLFEMYSSDFIKSVNVVSIGSKNFILSKEDMSRLEEDHNNVLMNLADQDVLENPVYVHLDENGVLLVD